MRVMLDTNIMIFAFIFRNKKMNSLIEYLAKNHDIIICYYVIDELKELVKSKFNVKIEELDKFLNKFPFDLVYSPTTIENKLFDIRDENDYIIPHTAIIEDVDIFITGDKDFFDIDIDKPKIIYNGIFRKVLWSKYILKTKIKNINVS